VGRRAAVGSVSLGNPDPSCAKQGVEDDPEGETYWKVSHGIRLTGMPAFCMTLTQTQLWQLATFAHGFAAAGIDGTMEKNAQSSRSAFGAICSGIDALRGIIWRPS
jgi:hypothetical protein